MSLAKEMKRKAEKLTNDQLVANAVYSGILINFLLENIFKSPEAMGRVLSEYCAEKGIDPDDMPSF